MQKMKMGTTAIEVPCIGQGTYPMGEQESLFDQEVHALQTGIQHGLTLLDTAEYYGDGGSERVVGKAVQSVRDSVYIVSKVWPTNGSYEGVLQAADRSVKNLDTTLDLYLLHWPSKDYPLSETIRGLKEVVRQGLAKQIGVSNFTVELMREAQELLEEIPLTANQVQYNLQYRLPENDIVPFCQKHSITVMGYSPFGQHKFRHAADIPAGLQSIADKHGATVHQVVLNWIVQQGVLTIAKATSEQNVIRNADALRHKLDRDDLSALELLFPRPNDGISLVRM